MPWFVKKVAVDFQNFEPTDLDPTKTRAKRESRVSLRQRSHLESIAAQLREQLTEAERRDLVALLEADGNAPSIRGGKLDTASPKKMTDWFKRARFLGEFSG